MIELEFTETEFQALAGLIDAGVRATGLRSVKEAAIILNKLEMAAANLPQQVAPERSDSQNVLTKNKI